MLGPYEWFGIISAVIIFVFGLYKWSVSRGDNLRNAINTAQDKYIQEHGDRLDRHSERLSKQDEAIKIMREEMSKNYVRMAELEKLEMYIREELKQVHVRLGGIAKDLNRYIGKIEQSHSDQLTNLVSEIKSVMERSNAK